MTWKRTVLACVSFAAVAGWVACADEPVNIDIRLYPARVDADPQTTAGEGWRRVRFEGSNRSRAGAFLVAAEPVLSGWNFSAVRIAEEPDGSRAVGVRLSAAGVQKLKAFTADEANLRAPLAVQVDERWVDFSPLLRDPGDRLMVYGLTPAEADRLEAWMKVR